MNILLHCHTGAHLKDDRTFMGFSLEESSPICLCCHCDSAVGGQEGGGGGGGAKGGLCCAAYIVPHQDFTLESWKLAPVQCQESLVVTLSLMGFFLLFCFSSSFDMPSLSPAHMSVTDGCHFP